MSVVQPGGADVPEIPDGLYRAKITSIKDITLETPDNFGNLEKVEIHLAFKDSDGEEQKLEPRVNRKWGERATLFAIALACGLAVEPHDDFETETLVGCEVNVLIETPEEGRWPRVKSWGRVKNGSRASTKATRPSENMATGAALVNVMGDIEWKVFWAEVERLGGTKEGIAAKVGGDLMKLTGLTVVQVQDLLEALK